MLVYIVVQQGYLNEKRIRYSVQGIYESEIDAVKSVIELAEQQYESELGSYFEDHGEDELEPQHPVVKHGVYPMKLLVRGSTARYSTFSYAEVEIDGNLLFK